MQNANRFLASEGSSKTRDRKARRLAMHDDGDSKPWFEATGSADSLKDLTCNPVSRCRSMASNSSKERNGLGRGRNGTTLTLTGGSLNTIFMLYALHPWPNG
jgi:hypothetical protein